MHATDTAASKNGVGFIGDKASSPINGEIDRSVMLIAELRSAFGELGLKIDPIMSRSTPREVLCGKESPSSCELHGRIAANNQSLQEILQNVREAISEIQL